MFQPSQIGDFYEAMNLPEAICWPSEVRWFQRPGRDEVAKQRSPKDSQLFNKEIG